MEPIFVHPKPYTIFCSLKFKIFVVVLWIGAVGFKQDYQRFQLHLLHALEVSFHLYDKVLWWVLVLGN